MSALGLGLGRGGLGRGWLLLRHGRLGRGRGARVGHQVGEGRVAQAGPAAGADTAGRGAGHRRRGRRRGREPGRDDLGPEAVERIAGAEQGRQLAQLGRGGLEREGGAGALALGPAAHAVGPLVGVPERAHGGVVRGVERLPQFLRDVRHRSPIRHNRRSPSPARDDLRVPAPVTVTVDVAQPIEQVYDYLDVMANHEAFTDHILQDWECSGPERGLGARARVNVRAAGRTDVVEFEVVEVEAPRRIVERNVGAKGRRVATGTYELSAGPSGGTHVAFTYRWETIPLSERLMAPIVRSVLRKGNERAMERLRERLAALPSETT